MKPEDIIAVCANLLSQIRDAHGDVDNITANDPTITGIEYSTSDILNIIRNNYGENFC